MVRFSAPRRRARPPQGAAPDRRHGGQPSRGGVDAGGLEDRPGGPGKRRAETTTLSERLRAIRRRAMRPIALIRPWRRRTGGRGWRRPRPTPRPGRRGRTGRQVVQHRALAVGPRVELGERHLGLQGDVAQADLGPRPVGGQGQAAAAARSRRSSAAVMTVQMAGRSAVDKDPLPWGEGGTHAQHGRVEGCKMSDGVPGRASRKPVKNGHPSPPTPFGAGSRSPPGEGF